MEKVTVVLVDGTVGDVIHGVPEEGMVVTVMLSDENGNAITVCGVVKHEL